MKPGSRKPNRTSSGQSLRLTFPRHAQAPQVQVKSWSNEKLKVP
jgi:hypothetical protein